ncbi:hypothetical protein ABB37_07776 [Leptomonas pyrrhocoris]|uniref:Leucine-rich repeat protein n=1 Tax=Leptomonas pyrrhocoris TaxID=157538 RepID=A0A0M9FUP1_LEPPY|nr:hypothetical protein ABB37_07776 [Leptomonas pyrrhocoris]XP_015654895.1 hypothetical protein ABB37_07776 [Leptomonas pyrrhocoris]KPA76455.1 hypothetical protein ABB37_07776 [Leptomonas pyrrhocoris]KPA76456.1 hypothetical protein ABB37_07776 [Leptomonas pyrrhocoris]|eukprot:XP_015654894.1 hypothetical protein ABB37_07776 [Leptomonas pyrrhocoris]
MLKNATSSASEDEAMEYITHSSVASTPLSGLDTIIHSINKRYQVYQKRRTAITPFCTPPADVFLAAPPTPRSILGDSIIAPVSSGGGSGGSGNLSKPSTSQPMPDALAESIVVAHARPAPYWEERELYIVAEDLCCHLNGGVNYRLLCEQYQRALEVLLRLVKEDVALLASSAVEVLPGGTTKVLGKLQALLTESRKMLAEAGINVPPVLSAILDQLPAETDELPFSDTPPAFRSPPPASLMGVNNISSSTSNIIPGGAPAGGSRSPHGRPLSALVPARRQPSPNTTSASEDPCNGHDAPPPPRGPSGGGSRRALPPRPRSTVCTPVTTHIPVHLALSGNAGTTTMTTGAGGAGTRRNTPSSAIIVAPPADGGQVVSADAVDYPGGTQERRSSILRTSLTGMTTPTSALATAAAAPATLAGAYVTRPPSDGPPSSAATARPPLARGEAKKETSKDGAAMAATAEKDDEKEASRAGGSPTPGAPPLAIYDVVAEDGHHSPPSISLEPKEGSSSAADQTPRLRGRLRLLEELYGEHYALDGMTLLTDALGVVFTREYDQGAAQLCQNSFTAFQGDVNAKVLPALKSYDALQLRITELTPLRSAYLASCLLRRVRPNDTVLDRLKRIDQDRTPETLQLGGLHLGDLGTAAVVESVVPRLYRLRTLNLSDNNLHDGALEPLLRSIRFHCALETVDLSRNPITDDGLPFLLRMAQTVPRLSSVILQSSGMTPMAKKMVETEVATPGTYTVSTPLLRRGAPSLSRSTELFHGQSEGGAGIIRPFLAASEPRAPHPPTTHRPPSSLDGPNRWLPKSTARADSLPVKLGHGLR